ncbi:MAG TPA: non-homologous end-joining DNA ligase [Labilithrix sp.]
MRVRIRLRSRSYKRRRTLWPSPHIRTMAVAASTTKRRSISVTQDVEMAKQPLTEYRRKRRADATNEPFGDAPSAAASGTLSGAFVVHLHDATRRHYDVRLEVGGVLASFAVPRGPSLNPDDKHLAVKTEDHPIEYLEFEDVIPEKQYGAGPMIAWDRGSVEYLEGPAEEEIARGKLHVRLRGMKLRGAWAFVKLAKSVKGDEWLFFKKGDEHSSKERSLVEELPRSVMSGLTVEELDRAAEIGAGLALRAKAAGASDKRGEAMTPILAAAGEAPRGAIYDPELEGVRVIATREGDVVGIRTVEGAQNVEAFYPEVVRAVRSLPVARVVLDGQIVANAESGHPSLALLAKRAARFAKGDGTRAAVETPAALFATDVLALGDLDVRPAPLAKRRELLAALLPAPGFLRAAPVIDGPLEAILAFCKEHGIAGVVAKPKDAPYDAKRAGWTFVASGAAARTRSTVDHGALDAQKSLRKVAVSNRDKLFWPDEGYTKGDLLDYYSAIADVILPHVKDRPVILVRYPDGIAGKSFYQWNVPPGMPPWVRTITFQEDESERRGFLIDEPSTLLYIANLACIPLHILACRVPRIEQADFLTIDFDVKQSELRHAITLAKTLRELLDACGLPGFPKTSGQSGLHVLVPLGRGQTFETARALADLFGRLLVERHPKIATMERVKERRGAKVYVDTGQVGQTRAIVAPYSVRAVAGATVSTPLEWDEVDAKLDPRAFTMKTVPKRVAKRGDSMRELLAAEPDVAAAIARLDAAVAKRH